MKLSPIQRFVSWCFIVASTVSGVSASWIWAASPSEYRVVRDVPYVQREAGAETADLYLPLGGGCVPGVLMVHGGAWMAGNKHHAAWHARRLAARGYAVMAINYRLAPQYPFPAQLEDCHAALKWMAAQGANYSWDPARLAAYGYSAGGHLVCLLGMIESQCGAADDPDVAHPFRSTAEGEPTPPVRLRAIVAGGAPCDFLDEPLESQRLAFWLGGTRQQRPQAYRDASPTCYVTSQAPPVFLFHGEDDRLVPLESPRRLYARLSVRGVKTQLHVVAHAGHLARTRIRRRLKSRCIFSIANCAVPFTSE